MNACFRCGDSIRSGETFCSGCRQEVDLDFGRPKSWGWRTVVWSMRGFAVGILAGGLGLVGRLYLASSLPEAAGAVLAAVGSVATVALVLSWFGLMVGVIGDVNYLHRYDAEWKPHRYLYKGAALMMVPLFFLTPLFGLWYRFKRARAVDRSQEP